jgi:hypothetical protein
MTEPELMTALADARELARSSGRPAHIVADRRNGWRITTYLAEADKVIVRDVCPPPTWTPEMHDAWLSTCNDMPDAAAALNRICQLASKGLDGRPRSDAERLDVLLAFVDQIARLERFEQEKSNIPLRWILPRIKSAR